MTLTVRLADLTESASQAAVVDLLDHYSQHEMGGSQPLPTEVKGRLIEGLRAHPMSRVFLAYESDQPVGIAVCFIGFSTFKAKPLINIHDLAVHQSHRACGVGTQLIDAVIEFAESLGCCAITLEVRADNPARKLYAKKGFQALSEPLAPDATLFGKLLLES
jgi:ribosomal protein S18 acetylase RimI-like enzyme